MGALVNHADLSRSPSMPQSILERYMDRDGSIISRAGFEANLATKLKSDVFPEDTQPLIPADVGYNPADAAVLVRRRLAARLPGELWR